MARFYKTDDGADNFDVDFAYKPPWELAKLAMATKQQGYDDVLQTTSLFDDIPIQHLGTEADKQSANNIKQAYTDRANEIANSMQADPNNYRKYAKDIRNLQRDLKQDMSSGNIATLQSQYAQMKDFETRHEEIRKTDPMRYQAARADAMSRYKNGLAGDVWGQEDIIARPEILDTIHKEVDDIKANKSRRVESNPNGKGYIIDGTYEVEDLSPERIAQYVASRLQSDPQVMQWARQTQNWGLGSGYFNEDGSAVNMFQMNEYTGTDAQGNPITTSRLGVNPNSGFSSILNAAMAKAYSHDTQEQKVRTDATYNSAMDRSHQTYLAKLRAELKEGQGKKDSESNYINQLKLLSFENSEKGAAARKMLLQMNAYSTLLPTSTPQITLAEVDESVKNGAVSGYKANLSRDATQTALSTLYPDSTQSSLKFFLRGLVEDSIEGGKEISEEDIIFRISMGLNLDTMPIIKNKNGEDSGLKPKTMYDLYLKSAMGGSGLKDSWDRDYEIPDSWKERAKEAESLKRAIPKVEGLRKKYLDDHFNNVSHQTSFTPINFEGGMAVAEQIRKYPESFVLYDAKGAGKVAKTPNTYNAFAQFVGFDDSEEITLESLGNDFFVKGMQSNLSTKQSSILIEGPDGREYIVSDKNASDSPGRAKVDMNMFKIGLESFNDPVIQENNMDYMASLIEEELGSAVKTNPDSGGSYVLSPPNDYSKHDFEMYKKGNSNKITVSSDIFVDYTREFDSVKDALEAYRLAVEQGKEMKKKQK